MEYACELVSYTHGTLVVMTVSEGTPKQPVIAMEGGCLYAQIGDEVLDAAHAILNGKNVDCTYLLENDSDVPGSIVRVADEQGCDGIVLGCRGMGAIEGLLRSSVSQAVAANAKVPVTLVK